MSSEYSKLNIDRDRIPAALKTAFSDSQIQGPLSVGNEIHWKIAFPGEEVATLALHISSDSRTTLNHSRGKNTPRAKEAADVIKKTCIINERKNQSLHIKSVSDNDFNFLLDHLRDLPGTKVGEPVSKPNDEIRQVKGINGDTVTIHRYTNKAVMIQGCPLTLFCDIVEVLAQLLPIRDVIAAQLANYNVDYTCDEALSELRARTPTAFKFLTDSVAAVLSPAITLCKINADLTDYSCFAFPALRGLEGYVKRLFVSCGITPGAEGIGHLMDKGNGDLSKVRVAAGNRFEMGQHETNSSVVDATCEAIQLCYQVLVKHRNTLFHVDGITITTRVLASREAAASLVAEVLGLIESTYVKVQGAKS